MQTPLQQKEISNIKDGNLLHVILHDLFIWQTNSESHTSTQDCFTSHPGYNFVSEVINPTVKYVRFTQYLTPEGKYSQRSYWNKEQQWNCNFNEVRSNHTQLLYPLRELMKIPRQWCGDALQMGKMILHLNITVLIECRTPILLYRLMQTNLNHDQVTQFQLNTFAIIQGQQDIHVYGNKT